MIKSWINPKEKKSTKEYHLVSIEAAAKLVDFRGKDVLVVGCSTGTDVALFVKMGANTVHGLDVDDRIGKDFSHPKVTYYKESAEKMSSIPSGRYDLVYSLATMEHVPNIRPAFKEMVRVAKPMGYIFSIAAPLWFSAKGHHKSNFFHDYPWIHLRLSEQEILEYCYKNNIVDETGKHDIKHHVRYMLDPKNFNMVRADEYIDACNSLTGVEHIKNDLTLDSDSLLSNDVYDSILDKSLSRRDLLAKTHTFIARKKEYH